MTANHGTEAEARAKIDEMLTQAGWNITDRSQVRMEVYVDGIAKEPDEEDPNYGHADYVLYDRNGRALADLEAKSTDINPYTAKNKALLYAEGLGAPFIFLSNGELTYFWDYKNEDARLVSAFFSQRDLERLAYQRSERKALATVAIPEHYSRQAEPREVRDYQQEAMRALDAAFELGKRRFLIELPTGTGKTDLVCLYLKRLFAAGWAERVLILVDRDQLAKQMIDAVQDILSDHPSYWLRAGAQRQEKQITVALLQTMIGRYTDFTPGYFDVVITDECHRSIYGAWQTALTHYDALQIGLTATPAPFIERNTFEFFDCKVGKPDFAYRIQDAFADGYLVPYSFAAGITEIISEGADLDEEHYDPAKFEREWTNEATNKLIMQEFDRLAWETYEDLAPGQKEGPGKAIVFAITKHHAARLAYYLNELHPEHKGRYAEVITSDIPDADDAIRRFRKETHPMIGVSVGMLDTGFDLREVLHLVMARRVRSPILYQQMRGRGTRTAPHICKRKFVIYDFFGNHEYFNDSDTDVFMGTGFSYRAGQKPKHWRPPTELVELGLEDEWLEAVTYIEVGPEGERIDKRDYITHWEKAVRDSVDVDPVLRKVREGAPLSDSEEQLLGERLNRPELYFNEDNLRRAYRSPGGTLVDFVRAALGLARVKSREERVEELFRAWLVVKDMTPEQATYLVLLKNRGIARGKVTVEDLFEPPLSLQDAGNKGVELFGKDGLSEVVSDLNASVFEATPVA